MAGRTEAASAPLGGRIRSREPKRRSPPVEVSVLLPCLNEEDTLAGCIRAAQVGLDANGLAGEVVVADNGSVDRSAAIARECGARLVHVPERGYGNALRAGITAARGVYVVMADSDASYDLSAISDLIARLRDGYDLVMGNRFRGGIEPAAMPWSHRVIGNPVLSAIGRLFFKSSVGDFHCGLRAFRRDAIMSLGLTATGMEFASEMVVKASVHHLRMAEVPIMLHRDGRSHRPHLRTWRDGWRHLRLMLLYSPRWLFLIPGGLLFTLGAAGSVALARGPIQVGPFGFDVDTLLLAGFSCVVGYQVIVFAVFTKVFAIREGLHPPNRTLAMLLRYIRVETGILLGALMTGAGAALVFLVLSQWASVSFGALNPRLILRTAIPACVLLALGVQTIFASFFISILGVPPRENDRRRWDRRQGGGMRSNGYEHADARVTGARAESESPR